MSAMLDELKARNPCDQVAARFVTLRRKGKRMIGPCPIHSPDPTARDSTSFECWPERWVCAVCNDGGDVIRLVERLQACTFAQALEYLGRTRAIDPEEAKRAEETRAKVRAERERQAAEFRERERGYLWRGLWNKAGAIAGSDAARYLELRHCPAPAQSSPKRIRYLASCPMYAGGSERDVPISGGGFDRLLAC